PDAGLAARVELVLALLPVVEVADDRHLAGVGSPDGERRADRLAVLEDDMGAELVVKLEVVALVEEVEVLFAQQCGALRRVRRDLECGSLHGKSFLLSPKRKRGMREDPRLRFGLGVRPSFRAARAAPAAGSSPSRGGGSARSPVRKSLSPSGGR